MSFQKILNKIRSENILFSVLLELTHQCNLDCFFCYTKNIHQSPGLRKKQYFQLFEDLKKMKVMELTFTGGEPLIHRDFFCLGRKAHELGFVVRLKSNGHCLNQQYAKRIKKEISPFMVDISLHGATPATHDRQTRVPGSFDRLMRNLQYMRDIDMRIKLSITLTAWNEHEIEKMIHLADKLGIIFQVNTQITPRNDGDLTPLSIAPSLEGMQRTFHLLDKHISGQGSDCAGDKGLPAFTSDNSRPNADKQPPATAEKICGIGSSSVTIDPYGNVLPCPQWRQPAGNLKQNSIQDIWMHSAELKRVRHLAIKAKQLTDSYGEDGAHMAFCLGQAAKQGHPLQPYGQALTQMAFRKQREKG